MKNSAFLLIMLFSIFSINAFSQKNNMAGVYKMIRQAHVESGKDSLLKREQIKFYTGKYMLHAAPKPNDSAGEFGIGKYIFDGNKLTEYVIYSSVAGDLKDTFELKITPTDNGFKQEIEFELQTNRKFILTEDYQRIGKPIRSALDGVWELEYAFYISKGGDTTKYTSRKQYKIYHNGYFAWIRDAPNAGPEYPKTSFGYGTFTLSGKTLKENNINSTFYTQLVGRDTELTIEQLGKNRFRQTIVFNKEEKLIEQYKKLE